MAIGGVYTARHWLDAIVYINPAQNNSIPVAPTPLAETRHVSIIGWIPYWDQKAAGASFRAHPELFDYVSFFWYQIDKNGIVKPYRQTVEDTSLLTFARANGIKTLAVVANLPDYTEGGTWDPERVRQVISSADVRAKHVADLVALARKHNFDGINIDYEALGNDQRESFTAFIKELSDALHKEQKILGVAIHPKTSEADPKENNGSRAQDWKAIAPYIDQMYFMTYSEHYKGSEPGPNASPQWVERILRYAVDSIGLPREKIFMGLPFYGHQWKKGADGSSYGVDDDLTFEKATRLAKEYASEIQWDSASQTPYFKYNASGTQYEVWFENQESVNAKLDIRRQFNIPNIALWRLGGENPGIWELLTLLRKDARE